MPTERFNRLPEEKKRIIREAAIKEFARVPFEKASINQIIHNAAISRGSFYTYFEDKVDVVRYIFQDSSTQMQKICDEKLEESGGDYFAMLDGMFGFFVRKMDDATEMLSMIKNVFNYEKTAKALGFGNPMDTGDLGDGCLPKPGEWLYNRIRKEGLTTESKKEFTSAILFGTVLLTSSIKQYYENPDRLEEIREYFQAGLNLLKRGMYNS